MEFKFNPNAFKNIAPKTPLIPIGNLLEPKLCLEGRTEPSLGALLRMPPIAPIRPPKLVSTSGLRWWVIQNKPELNAWLRKVLGSEPKPVSTSGLRRWVRQNKPKLDAWLERETNPEQGRQTQIKVSASSK